MTSDIQRLLNENWQENLEMADEERLLTLCAASIVAVILKRHRRKQNKRTIWSREWLKQRTSFGAYYTLMAELRNLDVSSYRNFIQMDAASFEELLQLVAPLVKRQENHMRSTIPPGERLAVTLRYLATGMLIYLLLPHHLYSNQYSNSSPT